MPRSQAHQRTCKANEVHSCRKGSLALRATPTTPNNLQTLSLRSERLACGRSPCASPAASAGCARSMRVGSALHRLFEALARWATGTL